MKFSIIIPVYNAEKTIERAIASLISNKDFIKEIIIINDHSDKDPRTSFNLEKFYILLPEIKFVFLENELKGPGAARRMGILNAESDWITFLDADDCLTPSSLYYVNKALELSNTKILYCQSIYYESGEFDRNNIDYMNYSCGGNFYYKPYLIEHDLLPDKTLLMAEDEYFNDKIHKYVQFYEDETEEIFNYYSYPVYEVHHDEDIITSFAHSNWNDYSVKYHLLYKEMIVNDFINIPWAKQELKEDYISSLIFCFFLIQSLYHYTEEKRPDISEYLDYYWQAVSFGEEKLGITINELKDYEWYYPEIMKSNQQAAQDSTGIDLEEEGYCPFHRFLDLKN